jgi:ABC-type antimicrobial peptide transport system permease subunit
VCEFVPWFAGYSQGVFFNSNVVLPSSCEAAGAYKYWVQLSDDGRRDYLQVDSILDGYKIHKSCSTLDRLFMLQVYVILNL